MPPHATFRPYDDATDRDALRRIWRECGWLGSDDASLHAMDAFHEDVAELWVAEIDGQAEACVAGFTGDIQHGETRLPAAVIGAVVVSLIARRQGIGGRLTARVMQRLALAGSAVGCLGIFDHGYYDGLGYGSGAYDRFVWLDPARLQVEVPKRTPVRLQVCEQHIADIHAARHGRMRLHGSVSIDARGHTAESMFSAKDGLGLGYRDDHGRLTHYLWFQRDGAEAGPWKCCHQAFETWDQYVELLGLLKSVSDQVRLVRLYEPGPFQLQSMVSRPFRAYGTTKGGSFWQHTEDFAWSQYRLDDVPAAIAAVRSPVDVQFSLKLADPVAGRLSGGSPWSGVAGDYTVQLGPGGSTARRGGRAATPALRASVNTFTQWWLGVMPASVLAARGDFHAPVDLIGELDRAIALPRPVPDWDF